MFFRARARGLISPARPVRSAALPLDRRYARRGRPSSRRWRRSSQGYERGERIGARRQGTAAAALAARSSCGRAAAKARWPHALLIRGRRGIGKRALALHFAQALLCEAPRPGRRPLRLSCAELRLRPRRWASRSAGDRAGERDEEGNETVLDADPRRAIRGADRLSPQLSTHRQRAKVARDRAGGAHERGRGQRGIEDVERAPPATYLILVSHQVGRLPATIVSRCLMLAVHLAARSCGRDGLARGAGHDRSRRRLLAQAGGAPLWRSRLPTRRSSGIASC